MSILDDLEEALKDVGDVIEENLTSTETIETLLYAVLSKVVPSTAVVTLIIKAVTYVSGEMRGKSGKDKQTAVVDAIQEYLQKHSKVAIDSNVLKTAINIAVEYAKAKGMI